jgi:hypothetical protein
MFSIIVNFFLILFYLFIANSFINYFFRCNDCDFDYCGTCHRSFVGEMQIPLVASLESSSMLLNRKGWKMKLGIKYLH